MTVKAPARHTRRESSSSWQSPVIGTGLLAAVVLVTVVAVGVVVDDFGAHVFRDPAALPGITPLTGAMSAFGIMLWAAAAALAWFSASMLEGRDRSFMIAMGSASAFLALDDQFMLHEGLPQESWELGQLVYVFVYGLAAIGIGFVWRDSFPGPYLGLLLVALGLFGLSMAADALAEFVEQPFGLQTAVEDSLKFGGIAYWTAFIALRARILVRPQRQTAAATAVTHADALASERSPVTIGSELSPRRADGRAETLVPCSRS